MAFSNVIHTVGRQWIAQILNGAISRPSNLYLGLRTLDGASGHNSDAALADTLTSNLFEVSTSGTGYGRITLAFNSSIFPATANAPDYQIAAAAQTFTFTGTVTGVTHAFLCTTPDSSGVLICSMAIPAAVAKNFGNTDTYAVTPILAFGTHA